MAKMVIRDHLDCDCGGTMFPCAFDRENRTLTYKCLGCGTVIERIFDEAALAEGEKYGFFCLNDDGCATWKCFEHGYCEFMIEDLFEGDRMQRFIDLSCAMCRYAEEAQADTEASPEDMARLENMLDSLTAEQFAELSESMGVESFDGEPVTAQTYMEYYLEAMNYGDYEGFSDFVETVSSNIFDLFEIEFDEDGNIFRL